MVRLQQLFKLVAALLQLAGILAGLDTLLTLALPALHLLPLDLLQTPQAPRQKLEQG